MDSVQYIYLSGSLGAYQMASVSVGSNKNIALLSTGQRRLESTSHERVREEFADFSLDITRVHLASCCGRVVKAMDSKSIGIFPRRFESCQQRPNFFLALFCLHHMFLCSVAAECLCCFCGQYSQFQSLKESSALI